MPAKFDMSCINHFCMTSNLYEPRSFKCLVGIVFSIVINPDNLFYNYCLIIIINIFLFAVGHVDFKP